VVTAPGSRAKYRGIDAPMMSAVIVRSSVPAAIEVKRDVEARAARYGAAPYHREKSRCSRRLLRVRGTRDRICDGRKAHHEMRRRQIPAECAAEIEREPADGATVRTMRCVAHGERAAYRFAAPLPTRCRRAFLFRQARSAPECNMTYRTRLRRCSPMCRREADAPAHSNTLEAYSGAP